MKFSKLSQLILVSSIGLLVATVFTACAITTIDYVFVACSAGSGTSSDGQIETYAVDSQSGALRTGDPAVSSGGVNPVSMAVTSDYANLYVANAGNSTIVHFAIGLNGVLTPKDTITTSGTPVALAVNTANTYLYVISGPSPSVLTAYALTSGTIGSAGSPQTLRLYGNYAAYSGDVIVPTGLTVLANSSAVYVTAYDQSAYNPGCTPTPACTPSGANPGWVFGFTVGTGGVLTAGANPYQAGIKPAAIAADPTNRYAYVTDYASNQLIGYAIMGGDTLSPLSNGPFRTGNEPTALTIDQRGKFIYVTNSLDSSVSPYAIDLATGTPTGAVSASGVGSSSTDTQPVAIVIDAALGRFAYTANYLGNSLSGFRLDPTSGALTATQATPYPTGAKPTAVVSIPHGNYSTQSVTP
jgi:6-phosphogluconolactonase (cycloisomerase 2 family)